MATKMDTHLLSIFVNNKPGVLMRICQVFSRRAFNIESLVVSHGRDHKHSRMTITTVGDSERLSQIIAQVSKLVDVIHCTEHQEANTITKELVLVKLMNDGADFLEITQIINQFEGKVVDMTDETLTVMLHGDPQSINWAVDLLAKFNIAETIRSGKIVMAKSAST